jgi:hypothetical protein
VKVLLDECIDWRLGRDIVGHEVKAIHQMGWAGTKNGALLALASAQFDAFVTADRNLSFQQNRGALPLPILVLHARSNRLSDLKPLIPELLRALASPLAHRLVDIGRG